MLKNYTIYQVMHFGDKIFNTRTSRGHFALWKILPINPNPLSSERSAEAAAEVAAEDQVLDFPEAVQDHMYMAAEVVLPVPAEVLSDTAVAALDTQALPLLPVLQTEDCS